MAATTARRRKPLNIPDDWPAASRPEPWYPAGDRNSVELVAGFIRQQRRGERGREEISERLERLVRDGQRRRYI